MHYEVKINEFEGPLDLLLHLIKKENIDIYEINIEIIINQYLEYIREMKELSLDIASEYLTMAAELIEIKSRALLPKKEIEEDTYEEDPKEQLIQKLVDYKRYKELVEEFKGLENLRSELYTKVPSNIDQYTESKVKRNCELSIDDLINAFSEFMSRKELEKPLNTTITKKEISIMERTNEIRNILCSKRRVPFYDLFTNFSKPYIVVTFLSILEMAKKQEVIIEQEDNFKDIIVSLNEVKI